MHGFRLSSAAALVVFASVLFAAGAQAATVTLSPYGSGGYRYRVGPLNHTPGFEAVAFADTGFANGAAGFGNPGASCSQPVVTTWQGSNTDLLVRKQVAVPARVGRVTIRGRVDDAVTVYFNGVQVGSNIDTRRACATGGTDFEFVVPAAAVTAGAANLLAVRARDTGGNQFLDVEVVADEPADLAMTVASTPDPVRAGDALSVAYTVRNNGPVSSPSSTFTAQIPAQTTLAATPSGCTLSGQTLTCSVGALAAGTAATRTIAYAVNPTATGTVTATATSVANAAIVDDIPANNTGTTNSRVEDSADLSLAKTVDTPTAAPGATRTYTLTARNDGPADARTITVTDALPSGVTFAGANSGCTLAGTTVTCTADGLDSGQARTFTITVTVDAVATPVAHQHDLAVDKIDQDVALDPGQTVTAALACPGGGLLVDTSFGVVSVDQGTGSAADVDLVRFVSTSTGAATATIANRATGRAQGKLSGLCLPARTGDAAGHSHALSLGGLGTATVPAGTGRQTASLTCAPGSSVASPGIDVVGGRAVLVGSERTGSGRAFTVDVLDAGATVTVSGRCLDLRTGTAAGHAHDLVIDEIGRTVSVPAGATVTESLVCADDAKGAVASFLAPAGIIALGNQPQPKSRVFTLQNGTGGSLDVRLGLTCVNVRTSDPVVARRIVNTATLANIAPIRDPDSADRTASATLLVVAGDPEPAANPSPAAPPVTTPAAPRSARATIARSAVLTVSGNRSAVKLPVVCSSACSGTVTLVAARTAAGLRAGTVIGTARFAGGAGRRTVRVALRPQAVRAARRGRLGQVRAVVRQQGLAQARGQLVRLGR
ncbi:hypothetical protein DSM112329_04440 [Paraconexibacter sp. AEG42_29]|uniref:DUF11 domain-containing protein n=1 Tax=Paraconexibacter sp. AEG42_29 TaxID=2997339 RepID=A0AAU7B0N9_9ACTN